MIRAKRTRVLSARTIAQLTPYARAEWAAMRPLRERFYKSCSGLWTLFVEDTPLCVIGVTFRTWLGSGVEVFFMLCKASQQHMKQLIAFLKRAFRHMLRVFGRLTVRVESDFWIGHRFVRFFGFTQTHEAQDCTFYELRASWL